MDVTGYYERSVNGEGLPSLAALVGAPVRGQPATSTAADASGEPIVLTLPLQTEIPVPHLRPERLAPVRHVLVHGSQATRDACAFSDIDVLVVLEDRRRFSMREHHDAARELRALLRAVYRYDPLMHHGLMFCAASRFDAYDQSFLPVEALRCSRRLHGPQHFSLSVAPANAPAMRARVQRAVRVLGERIGERAYERGDFAFKRFISNVLLLPALVAAARGEFVYKRDSFALTKPWFTGGAWSGIARAEEYRATWTRAPQAAFQRALCEFTHPCLSARWSAARQRRDNLSRVSPNELATWGEELGTTLMRAAELAGC
jgi:hypothetical protein